MAALPGSRSGRRSRQASPHFPSEKAISTLLLSTGFGDGDAAADSGDAAECVTGVENGGFFVAVSAAVSSSGFGLLEADAAWARKASMRGVRSSSFRFRWTSGVAEGRDGAEGGGREAAGGSRRTGSIGRPFLSLIKVPKEQKQNFCNFFTGNHIYFCITK
jgi:hypothetical protein